MENKKRIILPIISTVLLFIAAISVALAWYTTSDRKAQTDSKEIEIPPIIYIRDDNMDEMKTFNLAGLEKGSVYSFIFCVMPADKGISVNYQLAVAYTGNLGMDISLYPVSQVHSSAPSGTYLERTLEDKRDGGTAPYYFSYDSTNSSWATCVVKKADGQTDKEVGQDPNDGTRKTYIDLTFATEGSEPTSYLEELNDKRNCKFYVMKIDWEPTDDNTSYEKEVDIIYIIANGSPA